MVLFWTHLRKIKTRDSMGGQSIIAFIKTLKMKMDAYIGEYVLCLEWNLHLNLHTIFHKTATRNTPRVTVPRGRYQHEECAHPFNTCMHVWLSLWVASRSEAAIVLTVTSLGQFCFTSTEARLLIRDGGWGGRERGRGQESEGSTTDITWKRQERPWTTARKMEVLRRCPLAIAQWLVHCAVAVSTALLGIQAFRGQLLVWQQE